LVDFGPSPFRFHSPHRRCSKTSRTAPFSIVFASRLTSVLTSPQRAMFCRDAGPLFWLSLLALDPATTFLPPPQQLASWPLCERRPDSFSPHFFAQTSALFGLQSSFSISSIQDESLYFFLVFVVRSLFFFNVPSIEVEYCIVFLAAFRIFQLSMYLLLFHTPQVVLFFGRPPPFFDPAGGFPLGPRPPGRFLQSRHSPRGYPLTLWLSFGQSVISLESLFDTAVPLGAGKYSSFLSQ